MVCKTANFQMHLHLTYQTLPHLFYIQFLKREFDNPNLVVGKSLQLRRVKAAQLVKFHGFIDVIGSVNLRLERTKKVEIF